jgi:hypothetical protein
MKPIESHNSIGVTNKKFLLPGGWQIFLYTLISTLILIALNIKAAWKYLNDSVLTPEGGLDSIIANQSPGAHKFLNALSQSILLQFVFWLFVGCGVYIFIWFAKNIAINVLNDIVADKYVHPKSYNRAMYWESIIARKIFFGLSVFMLLTYLAASTKLLFLLANLCHDKVITFHASHSIPILALALLATTALVYALILLLHTVVNSWRLIYRDL